jgi:hypothetical protein
MLRTTHELKLRLLAGFHIANHNPIRVVLARRELALLYLAPSPAHTTVHSVHPHHACMYAHMSITHHCGEAGCAVREKVCCVTPALPLCPALSPSTTHSQSTHKPTRHSHSHSHIHISECMKHSHHLFPRGQVLLEHRKLWTLLEGNQRRYDCILKILDLYQSNKRYEHPHKSSQIYTSSNTEITSTMTIHPIHIITTLNTGQR